MNPNETNDPWLDLLACSAPTFAGEAAPPYGFTTRVLGELHAQRRQQQEVERIGWRALLASLGALAVAAALTVVMNQQQKGTDFDPGVRSPRPDG
ncbi:MAG: hypothetical protein WDO13_13005 [Verrucomicrobiota bacterium]